MCVICHKILLLLALSSHGNLLYVAVVVAIPILFPLFYFTKTTEFNLTKQFFKEISVFLFLQSNTA